MRSLEQRQASIEQAMRAIVQEFKGSFRPPRPAQLVLHHHGGYYHLRWRAAGNSAGGQTYFELTTSDRGQRLMAALPQSVTSLLLHFERQRLDLNLASSVRQHELRRLRDYLAKLDALGTCEREKPR